jgi:hypothetical protein
MHPAFGLLGVFVFGFGGAYLFYGLINTVGKTSFYTEPFANFFGFFVGLLVMGLGLWFIALSAKPDKEKM